MLVRRTRGWELPERAATPEHLLGRRGAMRAALGLGILGAGWSRARAETVARPLTAARNSRYVAGRPITPESAATTYNNYYEFSMDKSLVEEASALSVEPWTLRIEGMVKTPRTVSVDDLLKQMPLEERVTRHRCVEAWGMTVPWIGFPLAALIRMVEPLGSATYVKFTTLADDKVMPGLAQSFYPWPYTEGLTMQEAMNDLTFVAVGMYGKTLPAQNGAPIRMVLPWKYGFKSAKALITMEFTDSRPMTFWEAIQPSEYGFWANVNPAVPHPRWSQATERLLGSDERVPTQIWNGYGEFVASMYADKTNERLFA
jgi:sulfoxide reductase catalytic subunit YedY